MSGLVEIGSKSPDFKLPLVQGGEFELGRFCARGPVLLNFIRGTWCEYCTNHLYRVSQWEKKIASKGNFPTTLIVSVEEIGVLRDWLNDNPQNYLFASDPKGEISKLYGFMTPEDAYSRPAMVLVDQKMCVRLVKVSEELAEQTTENETLSAIQS